METLKALRRRTKSIQSTRHITHAMEMVSATKFRRSDTILRAGRVYGKKIEELLMRLISDPKVSEHPFIQHKDGVSGEKKGNILFVIFSSDRGFCGSFNNNLIEYAVSEVKKSQESGKNCSLFWIGKKGKHLAPSFPKHSVAGELLDLNGAVSVKACSEFSELLVDKYLKGDFDEIHLVHYLSASAGRNLPTIQQILPLKPTEAKAFDYIYEPDLVQVLDHILPEYLKSKIYTIFIEQFVCEHKARMLAMHTATKNCKELTDHLVLQTNKARQASITKDLLDIVGGAEAIA